MLDSKQIRRQNLEHIQKHFVSRKMLAVALEVSPAMLSQLLSATPKREIGDKLARKIEEMLYLRRGWMDTPHTEEEVRNLRELSPGFPAKGETPEQYAEGMISTKAMREKLERIGRVLGDALADTQEADHAELVQISTWDDETPLDYDEVYIPFLKEVELSAGSGRTVIEESSHAKLRFGKHSLKRHNVDPANAVCVPIKGNSMEPILKNGATVGVDRGNRTITDGDLYAISHSGQLRVKQLYRTPTGIRVRSFNRDEFPDEEYTWEQIEAQELMIIGRVFWWAMFA